MAIRTGNAENILHLAQESYIERFVVLVIDDTGLIQQQPIDHELLLRGSLNVDTYIITAFTDLILQPGHSFALRASSSGDTRGKYATDLQQIRNSSTKVAAGNYSVICGGYSNSTHPTDGSNADYAVVCGGRDCSAHAAYSFIGSGLGNSIYGYLVSSYVTDYSVICGGWHNQVTAEASGGYCFIGTGKSLRIDAEFSVICGGEQNRVNEDGGYAFIGGGKYNETGDGDYGVVCGGNNNNITATGAYNAILGGSGNFITGSTAGASIIGGYLNYVEKSYGCVIAGYGARAERYAEVVQSSGLVDDPGSSQTSVMTAYGTTTGTSWTTLYLNESSETIELEEKRAAMFVIHLLGRKNTSTFKHAAYIIEGLCYRDDSDDITLLYSNVTTLYEDDATWDAQVIENTTNQSIDIQVKVGATDSVNWMARIEWTQVGES